MLLVHRTFTRIIAISLILVIAAIAVYTTADATTTYGKVRNLTSGRWSDPAVWDGAKVPSTGDVVEIGVNSVVIYDVASEAEIDGIDIYGTLRFSGERSTNLDVGTVTIHADGQLEIGTRENPIPAGITATIRLVNSVDGENSIEVYGVVNMHGQPMPRVFSYLAVNSSRGARSIVVSDEVGWNAGDHIVLASTTQNPKETEENSIAGIEGRVITLRRPLKYSHSGRSPTRAEVANLTRNVVITSKNRARRGHVRILPGAKAFISYVEFAKLGPYNQMGKYPIHFHMAGDSAKGSYIKGSSIWDSRNRFITVHSTQFVSLIDNVGYKAIGHGFYMESGDESFVTWENNLGMRVRRGKLTKSDRHPAVFWIQNPHNTCVGNIAVSSEDGSGFDFSIPSGWFDIGPLGGLTRTRNLSILRFEGNTAHSNFDSGLRTYVLNGLDNGEISKFENLKLWRNGKTGASIRGNRASINDSLIFGNGEINVVLKGNHNTVENSVILGELPGTPREGNNAVPPTPGGVLVWGEDNAIIDSTLGGHASDEAGGGIDAGIFQDQRQKTNLTIKNSVLGSEKKVVLGHPWNEQSYILLTNYQRKKGENYLLYRMDAQPAFECDPVVSMSFMANVCAVDDTVRFPEIAGGVFQISPLLTTAP